MTIFSGAGIFPDVKLQRIRNSALQISIGCVKMSAIGYLHAGPQGLHLGGRVLLGVWFDHSWILRVLVGN